MTFLDPDLPCYEIEMKGITMEQLLDDCKNPIRISAKKHFFCKKLKKYKIPGLLALKLIRPAIIRLAKKYPNFPIDLLINFSISVPSSKEEPIYVGENLIIKVQIKSAPEDEGKIYKLVTMVEVYRKSDGERVMAIQSNFVNFNLKKKVTKN